MNVVSPVFASTVHAATLALTALDRSWWVANPDPMRMPTIIAPAAMITRTMPSPPSSPIAVSLPSHQPPQRREVLAPQPGFRGPDQLPCQRTSRPARPPVNRRPGRLAGELPGHGAEAGGRGGAGIG